MKYMTSVSVSLLLTIILLPLSLHGQATLGTIAGTVTDSSGAVVVGAKVDLQSQEGGVKRTATTGSNGEFRVEALNLGSYRVTVSSPNFRRTELADVIVNASSTTSLQIKLAVGKTSETVTVEATADHLQTETGE